MNVLCMGMNVRVKGLQRLQGCVGFPREGVAGSCELPNVVLGTEFRSSARAYALLSH